jgi:hypothetical protein
MMRMTTLYKDKTIYYYTYNRVFIKFVLQIYTHTYTYLNHEQIQFTKQKRQIEKEQTG